MNVFARWRAGAAAVLATIGVVALSACIVSPGAFEASLDLRREGQFTFAYRGEIYLLALSQLADMASAADAEGEGMRHNVTAHCDALARLPISDAMESLNVSNAAAIALYAVATRS